MSLDLARPLAATGVLGAILVLAALGAAAAWADLSSAEDELVAKADLVSANVQTIRNAAATQPSGAPARLLVEADTETLAAAQVDALVRSTATEAGGSVLSSRADAKHEAGELPGRIEVVAEVEAKNDVLQSMLLTLETGAPLLTVESLAIAPIQSASGETDPSPKLRADVTLVAHWAPPKPQ